MQVLVVDDDPNLLRMLRRGLILAGYTVLAAEDGEAALRLAREQDPDVVVLDVMLPEPLDGLEVARRLRAASHDLPILMLTARGVSTRSSPVSKAAPTTICPSRLRSKNCWRGSAPWCAVANASASTSANPRVSYADLELDLSTREAWRGGEPLDLTAREFDLLAFFVQHPRQVLTRERVFLAVWGSDFLGTSNIIDANVYCLRSKLEAGEQPRLIQTVRGVGYALRT